MTTLLVALAAAVYLGIGTYVAIRLSIFRPRPGVTDLASWRKRNGRRV